MTKLCELHKSAALLLIPVLITMWFVSDGGLRNGLNRLVFELVVGAFFAGYGLLWAGAEMINYWRKQPNLFNQRLILWCFSLMLAWTVLATLFEKLDLDTIF